LGALETYLSDVRDIKLSGEGVSELSYYPALRQLLEEVGVRLLVPSDLRGRLSS
jgi:hypothetical protein